MSIFDRPKESLNEAREFWESSDFWTPSSSLAVRCIHCGAQGMFTGLPDAINKASVEFYKLHDDKNHQRKRVVSTEGEK